MTLDRTTLAAAHCWFNADKVSGDAEMTAYKRETRYRQNQWRIARGYPVGSHGNTRKRIEAGGMKRVFNGSKLTVDDGERGHNFLSDEIRAAVAARLAHRQDNETLGEERLHQDLLSSMPMCFNLFGELSGTKRARAVAEYLLPGAGPGPVEVIFEWSPGRLSKKFTRDRTAFDAALVIGDAGSPQQFVGIETKYHEHAVKEANPNSKTAERHHDQTEFLVGIAEQSGVFRDGWEDEVLDTDLRQIWRDHLLALSMLAHPDSWSRGRYVLLHPARNLSFADAVTRYAALLQPGDDTFAALTLEELVGTCSPHSAATGTAFAERYLW